ncbi:14749_t:CDS:2, partial [Gigaspora rosea]
SKRRWHEDPKNFRQHRIPIYRPETDIEVPGKQLITKTFCKAFGTLHEKMWETYQSIKRQPLKIRVEYTNTNIEGLNQMLMALIMLWTMTPAEIEMKILTYIPEIVEMINSIVQIQPHRIDTLIRMDYGAYWTSLYTIIKSKENRIMVVEAESIGPHSAEGENLAVEFDPTVV